MGKGLGIVHDIYKTVTDFQKAIVETNAAFDQAISLVNSALEAETRYLDTVTAYDRALQQLKDLAEDCARAEKPKDDDDDDDDEDCPEGQRGRDLRRGRGRWRRRRRRWRDGKSKRLNSSH